jgi:hypothetical protein
MTLPAAQPHERRSRPRHSRRRSTRRSPSWPNERSVVAVRNVVEVVEAGLAVLSGLRFVFGPEKLVEYQFTHARFQVRIDRDRGKTAAVQSAELRRLAPPQLVWLHGPWQAAQRKAFGWCEDSGHEEQPPNPDGGVIAATRCGARGAPGAPRRRSQR